VPLIELFATSGVGVAALEAQGDGWLADHVPTVLRGGEFLGLASWQWIALVLLLSIAYILGHVLGLAVESLIVRILAKAPAWARTAVRAMSKPIRLLVFTLTSRGVLPYLLLPKSLSDVLGHVETTLYVVAVAWSLIAILQVVTTSYEGALPEDTESELANRGLRTRLTMLRRIGSVIIGIIAAGLALIQFEVVRNVGVSLLASAGIAGIIVGFAAQRTLGGLISGIEISLTQPLRIGDIVTFDGSEGIVERINFTYVVVRLGDDRRLIVPVATVMSKAFENLSLFGQDLLVIVDIFLDFDAPIDLLRAEFERLCKDASEWDGRRSVVVVADITDKCVKVRGIASVDNASKAAALRASLREGWLRFAQKLEGGRYFPKTR